MDPAIDSIIAGFRAGITAFGGSLGTEHPKVLEAAAALAELKALGEGSADVTAFMSAAGVQMNRVGALMGDLSSATPVAAAGPAGGVAPAGSAASPGGTGSPVSSSVPTASQVAQAYHLAYDQLDKGAASNQSVLAIYEHIFEIEASAENAAIFNRRLAEEHIYTDLVRLPQRAIAQDALRHISENALAQPCLSRHYELLTAAMDRATTAAEVEYEANLLVEYNAVENEWDTIFCHYATKAIGEVTGFYMDPSPEQQQNVEIAYRFVADFFGRDWNSMWQCPRVWQQWCMLFAKTRSTWLSERGCSTAEQARDYHTRFFEAIMQRRQVAPASVPLGPPQRQQGFRWWNQDVHMDQLLEAYRASERPAVDFSS